MVEEDEPMQRALNEGTTDEVLKLLEERKVEATKRINAFYGAAEASVCKAEKGVTERIGKRHKTAFKAVTEVLKKVQEVQELTDDIKEEALHVLERHFIEYNVRDNSEFVFGTVKKCIERKTDCSTLEHFFASMADDAMHAVVYEMKRCILAVCKQTTNKQVHRVKQS